MSERSRDEIESEIDRNKGAVFALYSRALRDNPTLQGEMVLDITISPMGEIVDCAVVSSALNDTRLLDRIVERLKLIRFREEQVLPTTVRKTMQFSPA
jgi:hypothetical protein